jgi:hypothetical protein
VARPSGTAHGCVLLSQLAEYLHLAGVTDIQIARPSTRGTGESRAPVWLTDLAEAADLDAAAPELHETRPERARLTLSIEWES